MPRATFRFDWPPLVTALFAVGTFLLIPGRYTVLAPNVAGALIVVGLAIAFYSSIGTSDPQQHRYRSMATIVLCVILTSTSALALFEAVRRSLAHTADVQGVRLFASTLAPWIANIAIFALWYWQLDRGGPAGRDSRTGGKLDLLFSFMTVPEMEQIQPNYLDYVFVSFSTSTAFGATDTLPLTTRIKMLMMLQAVESLVAIVLVASRAVGMIG